ncbi:hypothetical protein [Falsiroseomonas sp. HW251]|uniref:YfaP family protein n=1 Tax=Falsiroseomonas sp. HW251 TaxID=3390998 RepID=UPI003D31B325
MARSLAATTRDAELRALAVAGQPVAGAWAQITGHLIRRLSPAHAALFAEPSPDPARGTTDWYAEGEGELKSLDEVPSLLPRFEQLVADIRAESERLLAERDEGLKLLGELLRLALEVPDRSWIATRGNAIVLIAWGHLATGRAQGAELIRTLPNTAAPMTMLALGAVAGKATWPLALLLASFVALMTAIGLFLAWKDPFGWLIPPDAQCVADPADLDLLRDLDAARAEEATLRSRIAEIMEELGRRRLLCQPPAPPPPPPPPPRPPEEPLPLPPPPAPPVPEPPRPPEPPPQPRNDDLDRARREGGQEGRVQVILGWDTRDDLDLSIVCPNGQMIWYQQRNACGGTLDVDRNVGNNRTRTPVENVFFDNPMPGTYEVRVHQYDHVDRTETPYRVTIRIAGQPDRVIQGVARPGPPRVVDRFTIPGR